MQHAEEQDTATPLEAARRLAGLVSGSAAEGERQRRLPSPVVEAFQRAGLFRLCVPRSLGGGEADPATLIAVCEELARADAAAGWCVAVTATSGTLGAYLPAASAREVYGDPAGVIGGVFAPRGRAVLTPEGLRVNGRWPFASGAEHCDWLMGGCLVEEDGKPRLLESGQPDIRLVLFPAAEVEVIDTWTVSGLRGTGSHDMAIDGVVAPVERSASLFTDEPLEQGALYAFPVFGLLALTIAGVALGTARGAIEDVVELAGGKAPTGSARKLAERGVTQTRIAQAEAGMRAARAFLYEAVAQAWESATSRGAVPLDQRAALRLAATHATSAAAGAADIAYELGGGSSIYESSTLQRRFRDVHAATQHVLVGPSTWELTGRLLLGLPTDTTQL